MSDSETHANGLWASATRLLHKLVGLIESRVELFALEWQEQKIRLVEILVWTSVTVFLGGLSLVMLTITVLFAFWQDPFARLVAMGVMTFLYILLTIYGGWHLNRLLKKVSLPFTDSLSQIKKDRSWFES